MSLTEKGYSEALMLSGFEAEGAATFGTAVTPVDATKYFSMGAMNPVGVDWPDTHTTDKDDVTGSQFGTDSEITEKNVTLTIGEAKAKPNTVAMLAALVLGANSTTQEDPADDGYRHKASPVAEGVALKAITAIHTKGRKQHTYTGMKGDSLKLSAEAGGHLAVEAVLLGSGGRSVTTESAVAKITESWMAFKNAQCQLETGGDIAITATLVQGAEDISSGTPDDLKVRIKSFELNYSNNSKRQVGSGGGGTAHDIDKGQSTATLVFTLNFLNSAAVAEFDYYNNQNAIAFELDLKGDTIDATPAGTELFFGTQIIIARGKLMKQILPEGGPSDTLTQNWELDIQDDGKTAEVIIETYTAQAAYLA